MGTKYFIWNPKLSFFPKRDGGTASGADSIRKLLDLLLTPPRPLITLQLHPAPIDEPTRIISRHHGTSRGTASSTSYRVTVTLHIVAVLTVGLHSGCLVDTC